MHKILYAGMPSPELNYLKTKLLDLDYRVSINASDAKVRRALRQNQYAAIVLDACSSCDQFDPWRIGAEIRWQTDVPLIVLVQPGQSQDRVHAFRLGADHCLTIPITPLELSACLDATLLPKKARLLLKKAEDTEGYRDADLEIDFQTYQVRRGGQAFSITPHEYRLLRRLVENAGRVISQEELCQVTWGDRSWPDKQVALRLYMGHIREKIEPDAKKPRYLLAQRGFGYIFVPCSSLHPTARDQDLSRETIS